MNSLKKKTSFIEHKLSNFNIKELTKYYLVNYIYLYMYVYLLFIVNGIKHHNPNLIYYYCCRFIQILIVV